METFPVSQKKPKVIPMFFFLWYSTWYSPWSSPWMFHFKLGTPISSIRSSCCRTRPSLSLAKQKPVMPYADGRSTDSVLLFTPGYFFKYDKSNMSEYDGVLPPHFGPSSWITSFFAYLCHVRKQLDGSGHKYLVNAGVSNQTSCGPKFPKGFLGTKSKAFPNLDVECFETSAVPHYVGFGAV